MVRVDQIKEHMEIVGNDGRHVGIVDRVENDEIKLSKTDAAIAPFPSPRQRRVCRRSCPS